LQFGQWPRHHFILSQGSRQNSEIKYGKKQLQWKEQSSSFSSERSRDIKNAFQDDKRILELLIGGENMVSNTATQ